MKKTKLALLALALTGSSLALAQNKAALIQQYIDTQRPAIEGLARVLVERSSTQIATGGGQYIQTLPQDKREAAVKAANAELKKYFDEAYPIVRDKALQIAPGALSPVMDQNFTEDDLKQLLAWLSSPVSRKFAEANPKLEGALVEKLVAETRTTIEPRLVALNDAVVKALGVPVNPAAAAPAQAPAQK